MESALLLVPEVTRGTTRVSERVPEKLAVALVAQVEVACAFALHFMIMTLTVMMNLVYGGAISSKCSLRTLISLVMKDGGQEKLMGK